jgi:hypothetical protein
MQTTMTSRLGQKAVGAAVIFAIILLTVLIILLWTGVGAGVFSSRNAVGNADHRGYEVSTHDSRSHRIQNGDLRTIFSGYNISGEGLDMVTSTVTLLSEDSDITKGKLSVTYYNYFGKKIFLHAKNLYLNHFLTSQCMC